MVAQKFYIWPDILNEPFMVSIAIGESVVAKRLYRYCPIIFTNRVTHVELVELDMVDFDVILGMDLLHDFFATIDCRNEVVKFNQNEPVLEWKGKFYS